MQAINSKLPQDPYLLEFIKLSGKLQPDHIIVVDHETGVRATITNLSNAICECRVRLGNKLGTETLATIREGKEVFIATILPPGYGFVVAFLAALSLGAGLVPLSTKLLPEEVAYYVSQSGSCFILCDQKSFKLASAATTIMTFPGSNMEHTEKLQVMCLDTSYHTVANSGYPEIEFDPIWTPPLEAASLILFTSGSSGSPKGAMFPRKYLHNLSRLAADALQVTSQDVFLHSRGIHWVSGVRWSLGIMLVGARVEFCESRMSPSWWCRRVAEGGVTMCYEMPRIWMSIMTAIEKLPSLPSKGNVGVEDVKKGLENKCVGRLLPNVSVKIDESGQACVQSPLMFLGYVSDTERTKQALDEEGFFKTGDAVEIRNNKLYSSGRIGLDDIRFKGLKMHAIDIEAKINELPYVRESAVMPVPDQEFGQRVAAVIQVKCSKELPTLMQLREDLEVSLPRYKLPTVMILVDWPLLRTTTGKLAKAAMRQHYMCSESSSVLRSERWCIPYESGPRRTFAWDWAGMH
ncbi:hypothetical protein BFJ63_vAg18238 [Fusarium oxysporum f. sp. narcissi]|uniref:AMP-dependent synthetase/ligase domain-containing protein n=1 Tax=Fusarium oxysporum f. sp. narcissi TaxID=451672 RepID=A0A4Q2UYU9_FUSOX|nr:hypothetical protein BFJ63_vAg18238 [Fusarium oxysporum f. sp. narcissi]